MMHSIFEYDTFIARIKFELKQMIHDNLNIPIFILVPHKFSIFSSIMIYLEVLLSVMQVIKQDFSDRELQR